LLTALGLPTTAEAIDPDRVLAAVRTDKKARDGRIPFVLAPAIGRFQFVFDVPDAEVRAVLAGLAAWRH
jgi:shikimate kinase/3-dehydroquinate synthase